jgi:hypothetical protein
LRAETSKTERGWDGVIETVGDSPEIALIPIQKARGEDGVVINDLKGFIDAIINAIGYQSPVLQPSHWPYAENVNCQKEYKPGDVPEGTTLMAVAFRLTSGVLRLGIFTYCYQSRRFQTVPPMLSHRGLRSGSSIAALLTVCSSISIALLKHTSHSSQSS